ncbi:MAG: hypothetical protein MUC69_11600 [Gemmatimonadales bacterium]|nr:hypothetical protein [Gemmatimonadales bacterium]
MQLERSLRDPWVWGQFALIAAVLAASGPLARTLPGRLGPWSAIAGYLLLALGFAVMLRGAADLGRNLTPTTEPVPESQLVERGIYGLVREGKARTEERKLVLRHPRYREYAARVPRILPGGWK